MDLKGKETMEAERKFTTSANRSSKFLSCWETTLNHTDHYWQVWTAKIAPKSAQNTAVICRMIKEDPFISTPKISAEMARRGIKACPSTIMKWVHKGWIQWPNSQKEVIYQQSGFKETTQIRKWLQKQGLKTFGDVIFFRWEQIQHIWVRRQVHGVAEEKYGAGIQEFNPDSKTRGWMCTCMGLYEYRGCW